MNSRKGHMVPKTYLEIFFIFKIFSERIIKIYKMVYTEIEIRSL